MRPLFGRKRPVLSGFIPEGLGQDTMEKAETDRRQSLYHHAIQGGPIIQGTSYPTNPDPQDCA